MKLSKKSSISVNELFELQLYINIIRIRNPLTKAKFIEIHYTDQMVSYFRPLYLSATHTLQMNLAILLH